MSSPKKVSSINIDNKDTQQPILVSKSDNDNEVVNQSNYKEKSVLSDTNVDIGLDLLVNPEKQRPVKETKIPSVKTNVEEENNLEEINLDRLSQKDGYNLNNLENDTEFVNTGLDLLEGNSVINSQLDDEDLEELIDKQDANFYHKDLRSNEERYEGNYQENVKNNNINIIREELESIEVQSGNFSNRGRSRTKS